MGEAVVKFSAKRLKSLVLQEGQAFSGLEVPAQNLIDILDEIGGFYDSLVRMTEKYFKFESRWFHNLAVTVRYMEDYLHEFVTHMKHQDESEHKALIDLFSTELKKLEDGLLEIKNGMSEDIKEKAVEHEDLVAEGESSSPPTQVKLCHIDLPYHLRSCLLNCGIFPEGYAIPRGRLVRLLVAEGLIQEKPGELPEDIAKENIQSLVDYRLLDVDGTKLKVSTQIREFVLKMMAQDEVIFSCVNSDATIPPTTHRLSIQSDSKNIPNVTDNLPIQSVFVFRIQSLSRAEFESLWSTFNGKKLLRVLDLERVQTETMPDELGDMIHLRYLSLKYSGIDKLPETVSNLGKLQTLDVSYNKFAALPSGILNLEELRHLRMFKNPGCTGVMVPAGIGKSKNLQTLTGVHAGGGIAAELGELAQLRKLGIMDLTEDNVNDVCDSIMKMEGLLSLSLSSKHDYPSMALPVIEPFTPPTRLQKLRLEGRLEKLPAWFPLMENLEKLRLGFTHLSEDQALVLQLLPTLKRLTLWHAYDGTKIGKEFCGVGGFPKLEEIVIASRVLEEWTELEEGAFPSLKHLRIRNCLRLRSLPEGLQHLNTVQKLELLPMRDDLEERLKPEGGGENYKIKNIRQVCYMMNSMVQQQVEALRATSSA